VGTRSIDHLRKRRNHVALDEAETLADAPSGPRIQDPESTAALQRLPEEQRRCWVLKEFNDLSYEEIALTLNISPDSVRGRLARARTALARTMEEWR
jgi:RNA polymerase sigma-70 factor (ECF subfamily)